MDAEGGAVDFDRAGAVSFLALALVARSARLAWPVSLATRFEPKKLASPYFCSRYARTISQAPNKKKTSPVLMPRPRPKKIAKQATPARLRRRAKNKMHRATTAMKRTRTSHSLREV